MLAMALAELTQRATLESLLGAVQAEVRKAVVGYDEVIEFMLVAAVTGGHVLLEGPPGIAKTLVAGSMARALGVDFSRVQFTTDTTPDEITGTTRMRGPERVFEAGPIFTNVLLADEINRTPPRTQAALLEAMQERHVTVHGLTRWLPNPFLLIATQNPFELSGVFPLPESQLDRFLFKLELTYGSEEDELSVLSIPHRGLTPDMLEDIRPLFGPVELTHAQQEIDVTKVPEAVARSVISLVRRTRELPGVVLGCSPRSAVHLMTAAKANARFAGRSVVTVADVLYMAPKVLPHRLMVESSTNGAEVVAEATAAVAREAT
jgi:MoxR-like ATPase